MPQRPSIHRTDPAARLPATATPVFSDDLGDARGNVGARNLIDRHAVQRLEVRAGEIALQLTVGVWSYDLGPSGEIVTGHGPQCVFVLLAAGVLIGLRVLPERDLGKDLLRRRPCTIGTQHLTPP